MKLMFTICLLLYCIFPPSTIHISVMEVEPAQMQFPDHPENDLMIHSSNEELVRVFNWAKEKARFYVQTGKKGKVDVWEKGEGEGSVAYIPSYWAGYPGRTAFYSRDFCHQLTGAHLLGLEEENFTMLKAFAASADVGKKWFPVWAINFDGSIFKLDYQGEDNFVREVPATFELVEKALVLYRWTGDERYLHDEVLWNYYTKAVTDFVKLHDTQLPNGIAEGTGKGIFQGAASYNESPDAPLIEAGDGIASQWKAYEAYAQMAALRGDQALAADYGKKAADLKNYFNNDWGVRNTDLYNRGYLANGEPVAGWGKENSWFMPMKGITASDSPRTQAYLEFINERLNSKDDIPNNIEAISYIPETFFQNHRNKLAWKWMQHIMSHLNQDHVQKKATGQNGDYPEVSYVLIQNVIQDLLGISPDAQNNSVATLSHLPLAIEKLGVDNIKVGSSYISVTQETSHTSTLHYQEGSKRLVWGAGFPGKHEYIFVNQVKKPCMVAFDHGMEYSYVLIEMNKGDKITATVNP